MILRLPKACFCLLQYWTNTIREPCKGLDQLAVSLCSWSGALGGGALERRRHQRHLQPANSASVRFPCHLCPRTCRLQIGLLSHLAAYRRWTEKMMDSLKIYMWEREREGSGMEMKGRETGLRVGYQKTVSGIFKGRDKKKRYIIFNQFTPIKEIDITKMQRASGSESEWKNVRTQKLNPKQETRDKTSTPVQKSREECEPDDRWIYLLLLRKEYKRN